MSIQDRVSRTGRTIRFEKPRSRIPPRDHSTLDEQGKHAQAALSIVSFQVAGDEPNDAASETPTSAQSLDLPVDSAELAPDSDDSDEQLTLSPPSLRDDTEIEPSDEQLDSESAETLTDDGSFDLTVSTSVQASDAEPQASDAESPEPGLGTSESAVSDDVDDVQPDDATAMDNADETPIVEDISSFESSPTENVMDPQENTTGDPWANPDLFEPADEPADQRGDRLATQSPASPPQTETTITPIESSVPMPGPPPVADRVVTFQAKALIEDGIQLARRGAIYSARARFIRALRLITQAFDAQGGTRYYSESLARGFRALEEVRDFRPRGSRLEADLDLQRIVQSHRTPVLHNADFRRLTTLVAQQSYHTYAENQLIEAVGRDPVGADALFALGKVQGQLSKQNGDSSTSGDADAMSMYQAALTVHPDHHQAANELGVLFARYGQLDDARAMLRHCVRDRTNFPEVWRNLARVHEQLGEADLAKRANNEFRSAMQRSGRSVNLAGRPSVQWVNPETFTKLSGPDDRSPHQDIATRQRPSNPEPAVSRSSQRPPLPSADDKPLSVGQRYGR